MESFIAQELALNQRHEMIIARRELLLSGTDGYTTFEKDTVLAKEHAREKIARNQQLMEELVSKRSILKNNNLPTDLTMGFNTLRNNYWGMIKNVHPLWESEYAEFRSHRGYPGPQVSPSARSARFQKSPKYSSYSPQRSYRARTPSPGRRSQIAGPSNMPGTSALRQSKSLTQDIRKSY